MNIILLGYGTVGSGTYELIEKNKKIIKEKYNISITITNILVRNLEKYNHLQHKNLFTTDPNIITNNDVDVVISVMGGLKISYDYIKKALENKKHVITANKDLIAEHFIELNNLAYEHNVSLNYEASVAGGVPILKPIKNMLLGNNIDSIYSIINGTTNFILSQMYENNLTYNDALKIAQDRGFAESNPKSDVEGLDASRKLAIISMLTFNKYISWKNIKTTGITNIDSLDIQYAKQLNKKIKLFAISKKIEKGIYLGVRPVFIEKNNQLSKIDNEYNGIHLHSSLVGDLLFYGKGAGKFPTASAVFSDLLSILNNDCIKQINLDETLILENYPTISNWFIRFTSNDFSKTTEKIFKVFNTYKFDLNTIEFNKEITVKLYNVKEDFVKKCLSEFAEETFKYYLIISGGSNA
ncbi:MAG: homoserine dehydrogenase [Bacillota bacterium]|nr:homoserine dehydrogenase [Bacillota bacterium]